MLSYGVEWGNREVYVYNNDGTISTTHYIGDLNSQTDVNETGTYTFLPNGEIGSMTFDLGSQESAAYTYDDKKNPYMNITGYKKISMANGEPNVMNHNITAMIGSETATTTYTYNSDQFPVTSSEVYMGETIMTEFFYE